MTDEETERLQELAINSLADIIAKHEVPQEFVGALIAAYATGSQQALEEAEKITMQTFMQWGKKAGLWP